MVSRAGRTLVERVLTRLSDRERAVWKLTADECDDCRVSWWLVWFAFYQEAADPHDAAMRKVLGPRYQTYRETHNAPPAVYAGPEHGPDELDGRSALQWVNSVLSYLDWRSGREWRPMADRNNPDRRIYTDAALTLRQAFYRTPNRPPERFRVATKPTHQVTPMASSQVLPTRKTGSR